jgi:mono/diheme cytochrome c family protein
MRVAPLAAVIALLAAAPAQGGVRVVPPFDPDDYQERAAVGLLVPGAGPTVTRDSALNALVRGELEHELLGGTAPGNALIELDDPGGPEILVSLPPPGRSENDRRYPIALLGERGLLTSDSTRIDGLVSITDVATGRLRVVDGDDPVAALETLDHRIDRNDRLRLPLTIALAALLIGLSLVRPGLALRALLVVLAANLWLDPVIAIAAGAAAVALPLGLACASILAAYLVSMGLDAEAVALSPFGPSQSGRFYGINNLLETMLLAPSLVGAALLGRRAGVGVAALAFITIGGNRFGADGGGIIVLAAAYLVLWLRLRGRRPTLRLAAGVAAGAVAVALLVLALDAATGGSSHVTDAVGDGPVALAADLADRIELSVRRTAASAGSVAVVLGSLAILVAVALRRPRDEVLDAYLAGIAVSLLVNDTPGDVAGIGAAIAIVLARYPPLRASLHSPAMRRAAALLAVLALTAGVAGCGGEEEVSPTPETIIGTLPEETTGETTGETTSGGTSTLEGDPAAGEAIFASAGCGGCHTLEAAGSSGTVGPNLDESQPDFELAVDRVTNGAGAMPAFEGQLSEQEIADVAAYVVENTSG